MYIYIYIYTHTYIYGGDQKIAYAPSSTVNLTRTLRAAYALTRTLRAACATVRQPCFEWFLPKLTQDLRQAYASLRPQAFSGSV